MSEPHPAPPPPGPPPVEVPDDRPGLPRGLWFAAAGALAGFFASTVVAMVVIVVFYDLERGLADAPIWVLVLLQVPLWAGLLGAPWVASRTVGTGSLRRDLRLRVEPRDVPIGLSIGVASQILLVPLVYVPLFRIFDLDAEDISAEAQALVDRAPGLFGAIVLVLMVVVAAPVVEEIFYRGLVQATLQRHMGGAAAVALASVVFGVMHLQLVQLPALIAFGLVAGLLALRTGRLGSAIFAHVGFNAVTVAFLLARS